MKLRTVANFCHEMGWYTAGICGGATGASMNLQFAWLIVLAFFFWGLELAAIVSADRIEAAK